MSKKRPTTSARPDADRRVRQAGRFADILKTLELISGHGRWDAAALARELECSQRTVHRHLEVLKYAGVLWWYDKQQRCYRVRPEGRFPILSLNEDELLAQAMAGAVASAAKLPRRHATAATRKLSEVSGDRTRRLLADAERLVAVFDLQLAGGGEQRVAIREIQRALIEGKQLAGTYESPYLEKPRRLNLHPYRLCLRRRAWYLIARPKDEAEPRTYRVARFSKLRMRDAAADVPEDFELVKYFGNAWSVMRGGEPHRIRLRFSPDAAVQATETEWHHTQQATRHKDGAVTLEFTVDGLLEILWWLLGWSGFVTVEEPGELREMFVAQLREGVKMNAE